MGSCISKCKARKKFKKEYCIDHQDFSHHVHDKLVISQAPISSSPSIHQAPISSSPSIHQVPGSPSSAASTTSLSSVSGGNSCNTSTEFSFPSSSSCSSSVSLISKDRSFSNEFLRACAKKNPQIIGRNVIKGSLDQKYSVTSTKVHPGKFDYPVTDKKQALVPIKQAILDSYGGIAPKKRARASSPTLVRQKSFRKQPDKVSSSNAYHLPNRTLLMRSPSPSRRFNGESLRDNSPMNTTKEHHSRKSTVPKTLAHNFVPCSSMRRENFRTPPSPNYDLSKSNTMSKPRDALITQQLGPGNGKIGVGKNELYNQDLEAMIIEDIHNPLIALDCFIFL